MINDIFSLFIVIIIICTVGAYMFTGDKNKNSIYIFDKRWKTFTAIFVGYSIISLILILI